ncbi:MAG: SCO family protein [Pseudomonadota bacterium]
MQRIILAMAGALVVLVFAAAVFLGMGGIGGESDRPAGSAALQIDGSSIGGPFTLVDHTGETRTSADLIDKPTLIYFGYTFCPDVCPVDTQVMTEVVDELAKLEIDAQPVFITVDPARDDVETMAAWAEIHHPKLVAMTGSNAQVEAAKAAYKVFAQRVEVDGEADYLMSHTSFLYFADTTGLRAAYRTRDREGNQVEPATFAADIDWVLTN